MFKADPTPLSVLVPSNVKTQDKEKWLHEKLGMNENGIIYRAGKPYRVVCCELNLGCENVKSISGRGWLWRLRKGILGMFRGQNSGS